MKHNKKVAHPLLASPRALVCVAVFGILFAGFAPAALRAQGLNGFERERGRQMLKTIKDDVKKNYYDPTFRGIDIDARFKEADEMIQKAESNGQVMGIIALTLIGLNDSHTFFIPPQRVTRTEYGWQMQMIGDKCYVVGVKPGSDAEAKGLKEGDEILLVDEMKPTRSDLWKIHYLYNSLRPMSGVRLTVQSPGSQPRALDVMASLKTGKRVTDLTDYGEFMRLMMEEQRDARLNRHRYYEVGNELFIWKMPQFDLPKEKVDDFVDKFRKHKTVILDLRGNGGGYLDTLVRLIGNVMDREVKVGDTIKRKETKPLVAKSVGERAFKGRLIVLVDSMSGSSSELFARVMQLEKRATVIGDVTAGAVMGAIHHSHKVGIDTVAFYGASITVEDLIMTDGKSLEHVGVTPDELLLPSATDMAAKRDVVLARALELAGANIDPAKAGALFPVEWRK
ncbi:MAG: hypothetical protein LC803_14870 [Acidobacteria bacterium]|nr:hypothetical protein [Acidobacteriota bacterium]